MTANQGKGALPVLVRDATAADIDQIQTIYAYYVAKSAATFEEDVPGVEEMARRLAAVQRRGFPYLVAEDRGEIVGYCYAGPWRERSAYRYTVEDSIYVAPFVQRRGVGRILLGELIDRCAALGYRRMIAVIGDSANQGSISLHRALGFCQEGVLRGVGLKFGRWVDVVIMHRMLGDDSQPLPDGGLAPPLPRDEDPT
ncbi:GNAT family N-acetyltransferase [Magnetospirillum moscoviense]|uniref:GCN5 family acetyltransferase n=1 Tax=Magnetospirillum moscoviense TaxID=1437059 RepID=A0A178M6F9_9PROT|nr:GNAT family N-acetyltransferase [Magnetospirillum moscoviense]OAN44350.1 GCN5 family acetyltransferase [Magnetospirillum moscoviense]